MADKARSKGRLLLCSDEGEPQEISPVHMGGTTLLVSMPPIWPSIGAQRFHKTAETNRSIPEENRDQIDHLSRRHLTDEPRQDQIVTGWQNNSMPFGKHGVHDKHKEIDAFSHNEIGIPRHDGGQCTDDSKLITRENREGEREVQASPATAIMHNKISGRVDRDTIIYDDGHPASPTTVQTLTEQLMKSKSYDSQVELSVECKEELRWWLLHLQHVNGKAIISSNPDLIIETDASLQGWGATDGFRSVKGHWTETESKDPINALEMRPVGLALKTFFKTSGIQTHSCQIRQ